MGLRKFLSDLVDPGPWLSVTIENEQSGKSITLFHHQAEHSEVEHAVAMSRGPRRGMSWRSMSPSVRRSG